VPKWEGSPYEGMELIATSEVVFSPYAGWEIKVDTDKAPCPMCWGEGNIDDDLGYDEEGNFLGEIEILCPRCQGIGKWKLEQDNDGQENS